MSCQLNCWKIDSDKQLEVILWSRKGFDNIKKPTDNQILHSVSYSLTLCQILLDFEIIGKSHDRAMTLLTDAFSSKDQNNVLSNGCLTGLKQIS